MTAAPCMIGVDLGGTKISAGLVSPTGEILARDRRLLPHPAEDEPLLREIQDCIAAMVEAARQGGHAVDSIGLGIPAIADGQSGQASTTCCPNLPLLERCDLAQVLREAFALPVEVANDANCFVLGEYWAGQGQGARDLIGLTLGTGLGCGMVLGGRLHVGRHGRAGEIWDAPLLGGGILEDWLCGPAVARMAGLPSAREAAEAARQGHEPALAAWAAFGNHLGITLALLERALDPELFVLGGSLVAAYDLFYPALADRGLRVPVVASRLGEDAALVGAAGLVNYGKVNEEKKR